MSLQEKIRPAGVEVLQVLGVSATELIVVVVLTSHLRLLFDRVAIVNSRVGGATRLCYQKAFSVREMRVQFQVK